MKILLLTAFVLAFAAASSAQAPAAAENPPETVAVDSVFLAKDDGEGKAGTEAESFLTTDVPIYCVVQLTSTRPVNVRLNFVAVAVPGVKAETKVVAVSYRTNGRQDRVSFTGRPETTWIAGTYRVDIFLDEKPATSRTFVIGKPAADVVPAARFVEPKPKTSRPRRTTARKPN